MSRFKTPLDVYKILPKTNCGHCAVPTCLTFSAAVIKNEKRLADCPYVDRTIIEQYDGTIETPASIEKTREETVAQLKERASSVNLASRAERLGGRLSNGSLVIKCLGKDFAVDGQGSIASQCHTHAWFAIPFLQYVLFSTGKDPSGTWVPFRELEQGRTWAPLFGQRCEKPLKHLADTHTELFDDLITLFSGMSSDNIFDSDISVVLYPLPKVPILICYWKPEDDLESQLNMFFDDTAEENLSVESLYALGAGIVSMLETIMQKHR